MPRHFPVTQELSGLRLKRGSTASNLSLANATVHNSYIEAPKSLKHRSVVRGATIRQCEFFSCNAAGALFEDVNVDDIRGGGRAMSFLWGCVYSNVQLKGWIGGVLHRWMLDPNDIPRSLELLPENARFYDNIELALDIAGARFTFTQHLLGVPSRAVRRNPAWHYILTAASASFILADTTSDALWKSIAKDLLDVGLPEVVVVLGESGSSAAKDRDVAERLRKSDILT